jgi:hypothetical protein
MLWPVPFHDQRVDISMVGSADPGQENVYIVNNFIGGTNGINCHTSIPTYTNKIIVRNNIFANNRIERPANRAPGSSRVGSFR